MPRANGEVLVSAIPSSAPLDVARWTTLACAAALVILALLGLVGSLVGKRLLDSTAQIFVPMAPSTATFFLTLAVVHLLAANGQSSIQRIKAMAVAIVGGLALLNLAGMFLGRSVGLLDLIFQQVNAWAGAPHVDMSPATATLFALASASALPLFLRHDARVRIHGLRAAGWLGAVVVLWGCVFLLGYAFGTPLLYSSGVVPMARSTALGFILLGVGLVCAAGPKLQPLRMFTGPSARAILLRAFVPLVAALSLAHSLLLGQGDAHLGPDDALVAAGVAVGSSVAVALGVLLVARRVGGALERAETRRYEAEQVIRTALQEKTVMLKELHHRVKNNIQIVSSLLSLQSEYVLDPRDRVLFEESRERLKSMALVHEHLYAASDLSYMDMPGYVRQLVDHLFSGMTPPVRAVFEMDDVRLPITQCVPCGLLVNELLINTMKHAFPHNSEPVLQVTLHANGAELELSVQDNGPGLSPGFTLENHATLGMLLMSGLAQQLHGRFSADNAESGGARFILRFPKDEK
ncbi:MAG: histidine kinase dimerization/phosphoacceptor domain -containing protein [Humidesulfovibrio sp.]|nr:histidine kinase dimerization/phosphoacceptor domain -containing protein [Humidesulfovibrio sp.]